MPGPWKSWTKSLSCKTHKEEQVHSPVSISAAAVSVSSSSSSRAFRGSNSCSRSLSNLKEVIHGNTKVVHKSASCSPQQGKPDLLIPDSKLWCSTSELPANAKTRHLEGSQQQLLLTKQPSIGKNSGTGNNGGSMRRFGGGCHGCNVADEAFGAVIFHRDYSRSLCRFPQPCCQKCGESFSKYEALEHHHAVKHAVTELGRGDSSKNIVEIIFRTSWLKKDQASSSGVKIERILKVNNTQRTISKFEEYRDQVKFRASSLQKKHARCIADGNELLRFHATTMTCNLGANNSSSICSSPSCSVCRVIKSGFCSLKKNGVSLIHTTATSGKAHDSLFKNVDVDLEAASSLSSSTLEDDLHAMLVCRVIAGRMHKGFPSSNNNIGTCEGGENVCGIPSGFDSIAGDLGPFSNVDDLYVLSSKAVLPCFVVIYRWKSQ